MKCKRFWENEHAQWLSKLASNGADIEIVQQLDQSLRARYSGKKYINRLLGAASGDGDLETVKHLIDHGAEVTASDAGGANSAIRRAAKGGHLEVVKFLIDHGADINAHTYIESDEPDYPILSFVERGNLQAVEYLISQGADVTVEEGEALICASGEGHIEIAKLLVKHGADPKNTEALADAIMARDLEMVKFLVERGARFDGLRGFDPAYGYRIALKTERDDIIEYLSQNGLFSTLVSTASADRPNVQPH